MRLHDLHYLFPLLRCPQCKEGTLSIEEARLLLCTACATCYPVTHDRPVLLRNDNALFCLDDYRVLSLPHENLDIGIGRFIPSPSVNLVRERILTDLKRLLADLPLATVLVVGGGRQRKWLDEHLKLGGATRVVYSDIDVDADVDLFCDGHDLPFMDGAFDAVITTAVLEHVIYPERVASEITRVLKLNGLLYSELPFMQQVHEGAYDFTRYTLSGHRRLFNQFKEIEAGMVAGPATAFVWALENLILAFFANNMLRKLAKTFVRLFFGWIKYLDYHLKKHAAAMDGASCTFIFASKDTYVVSDIEIINRYVGAKHTNHF
jgi:SAM-dependent methyltransferase/uncharacterized protein YbaR (Trm112 family)